MFPFFFRSSKKSDRGGWRGSSQLTLFTSSLDIPAGLPFLILYLCFLNTFFLFIFRLRFSFFSSSWFFFAFFHRLFLGGTRRRLCFFTHIALSQFTSIGDKVSCGDRPLLRQGVFPLCPDTKTHHHTLLSLIREAFSSSSVQSSFLLLSDRHHLVMYIKYTLK